jgi:hypothetical protein
LPCKPPGKPENMADMNKRRGFAVETLVWVVAVAFGFYARHHPHGQTGVVALFLMFAAIGTTIYRRALNST